MSNDLDSHELDQRLERWADWARSPIIGSVNTAVGYMRERLDRPADSAEMTVEIAITERAIARTKQERKAYWQVIARYYLGREPLLFVAEFFGVSEDSVKVLFLQAKSRVGEHIATIDHIT